MNAARSHYRIGVVGRDHPILFDTRYPTEQEAREALRRRHPQAPSATVFRVTETLTEIPAQMTGQPVPNKVQ